MNAGFLLVACDPASALLHERNRADPRPSRRIDTNPDGAGTCVRAPNLAHVNPKAIAEAPIQTRRAEQWTQFPHISEACSELWRWRASAGRQAERPFELAKDANLLPHRADRSTSHGRTGGIPRASTIAGRCSREMCDATDRAQHAQDHDRVASHAGRIRQVRPTLGISCEAVPAPN